MRRLERSHGPRVRDSGRAAALCCPSRLRVAAPRLRASLLKNRDEVVGVDVDPIAGREFQFTTSLTVTVCVLPPPVPLMVRVYVPLGVPPPVFTVSTEDVVAGFRLKPVVEPDGNPPTERLTELPKLLSALIAIV